MKREKGIISPLDLMLAVFCFMQASTLRSGYILGITRQDSWAMAITGFLFSLPVMAVLGILLKKFPGKNLFEIDDLIFGPIAGKVISALYLFFFASLAALNIRDLGNFVVDYLMPETPLAAIFLVFLIGCVYCIRKGIQNLLHLSALICFVTISALAVNSILILRDIHPEFLKPVFQLELNKYVQGTVSVAAVPMGEVIVFTMLTPMMGKSAKAAKPLVLGLMFATVSMIIVIIRDIVTLGPLIAIVSLPSFESVRYISLSVSISRMESIYATILIILFLFKISILLYAFVLGLTQMLSPKSRLFADAGADRKGDKAEQLQYKKVHPPLLLVSAALVFFYSQFIFKSVMENMEWGATTAPFFSLTFAFLIPAISLLTAFLRKCGKPREVEP